MVYAIGIGAIRPVLLLAAVSLGFSHAGGSAVVGTFGVVGVVAAPFLGKLLAKVGDRPALAGAGVLSIVSLAICLVAMISGPAHADVAKPGFIVALVALAVASNIWQLGRQSYVSEHVPASWRARALSTFGGTKRMGDLAGPLFSSGLIALWFMGSVFWFGIVTSAISLAMTLVFLAPQHATVAEPEPAPQESLPQDKEGVLVPSPFATVVMGLGLNAVTIVRANRDVIVPLWGTFLGLDPHLITLTFAISAALDTAMFFMVGGMMDRYGRLAAIVPSLTVMPAGIAIMLLWPTTTGFIVGAIVLGIGNGFGSGILMTTGADLSPEHRRPEFLGIWLAICNAGQAGGPFIASAMTKWWGVSSALWATIVIGLAGCVWSVVLIRPAYGRLGLDTRGRRIR